MIHTDLEVYKTAIEIATDIYKVTAKFPEDEKFVLTSQIRRSAVSISSNIAEGAGRKSDKEFINFLYISLGSVAELETQLLIATNIGYLNRENPIFNKLEEMRKPLLGLIKYLKSKKK